MAAPESVPQHLTALRRANAVRFARADLKRKVRDGERSIVDVLSPQHVPGVRRLEAVPWEAAACRIGDVLTWPRRWGPARTTSLLYGLRIAEHVTLGDLTDRQRWAIVSALTGEPNPWAVPNVVADARAAVAARSTVRPPPPPAPPPPAPELPPALRVACPYCTADVGERCATYDPLHDLWHEPAHPHMSRVKRAAKRGNL